MRLKLKSNPLVRKLDRIIGIPVLFFLSLLRKKRRSLDSNFTTILLIRFAALGDTVLLIPAIRSLRNKYTNAKIDFLCSNINFNIIANCPYINQKYQFAFSKKISKLKENIHLLYMLRKSKYDLIIDFEPFVRLTAIIALLLKGKFIVGFNTFKQFKHLGFDSSSIHSNEKHELDNFFSLISLLNCNTIDRKLELWTTNESNKKVDNFLSKIISKNDKLVIIHPSTGGIDHPRQWPEEYFVKLIRFLLINYDVKIILIGSLSEKPISNSIAQHFSENVFDISGTTDLFETIEIIKRANLFISGNTGTMHIASVFDIPLIALHGPTNPKRFGPLGKNSFVIKSKIYCSPCLNLGFEYGCKTYPCMKLITPKEVIEFIKINNPL